MALTQEQFQKLRSQGFTTEKIVEFEKKRTSEQLEPQIPDRHKDTKKTLWQALGAEVTPGMEEAYPIPSAIAKTGQEVATAPAHFLNQLLMNYPRAALAKGGIEYPEAETLPGKILSRGAGVAGGFKNPLIKALGTMKLGRYAAKPLAKIGTSALKGATIGGAYAPTEDILSVKKRIPGAVVGGLLGGGAEAIGQVGSRAIRGIRKYKTFKETPKEMISTLKGRAVETGKIAKQNIATKMKQDVAQLEDDYNKISEIGAKEFKRRFKGYATRNSESYGKILDDDVSDKITKAGKNPTKQVLQDIFDRTDQEIAETFIDTGAPLQKYNALKAKYIGGLSEANPEAQAIAKALGLKKGQLRGAGIDWSKVSKAESQFQPPDPNQPVNFKELIKDIRSVSKAMSMKAKGAERAFTDEDLVNNILQKNFGKYAAEVYPEFAELQSSYAPVIETMKAGRKIFKPGAPFDLGTAPKVLRKPDIAEAELIKRLETGTERFGKGVGKISEVVKKGAKKITGREKAGEIATKRIDVSTGKRLAELTGREKLAKELGFKKLKGSIAKGVATGGGVLGSGLWRYLARRKLLDTMLK